eukprot:3557302-Rhodomonas_salina.1
MSASHDILISDTTSVLLNVHNKGFDTVRLPARKLYNGLTYLPHLLDFPTNHEHYMCIEYINDETDLDADLAKHMQLSEEIRLAERATTAEFQVEDASTPEEGAQACTVPKLWLVC